MAWQLWPALSPLDRLMVPREPPAEYLQYLQDMGFSLPPFGVEPDPSRLFTPFGWNQEAEERNLQYREPAAHPDPGIVSRVNSREFSLGLETELSPRSIEGAAYCRTSGDLTNWFCGAKPGRWVAKGNHGHAGIGQHRFSHPGEAEAVRTVLNRILKTQGGLVLEPEHPIVVEFGCLFWLRGDGSYSELRCHRLLSYSGGGFAGALRLPEDPELERWRSDIQAAAGKIAARLHQEGYSGPVGVDMYVWRRKDGLRFRSLADLNARCSMAFPVHGLSRRFPDRAVMVSQTPSTILLPENTEGLRKSLGILHFDPGKRSGVFLVTPLTPGPRRHAWAFIGGDETDLQIMREKVYRMFS
jgi:hypothetical protein